MEGVKSSGWIVDKTCREKNRKRRWNSEPCGLCLADLNGKDWIPVKVRSFMFFGFILLCTTFFVACTDEAVVPDHLLGVWKTSEPKFSGCKIEFRQGVLILGLQNGEEAYCAIRKIESAEERGRPVRHTVHYKDAKGQKSKMTFLYSLPSGGALQLKNHPEIWKKTD